MRKYLLKLFYLVPLAFIQLAGLAQVTISGPVCVLPGTTYQYYIQGSWDSVSTMQVCVTGGTITDSSASSGCTVQGAPLGSVSISWDSSGSLNLTSSIGNTSLSVQITTALQAGDLDSAGAMQFVFADSIPNPVTCSAATGGACSPAYSYHWQQSSDASNWTDMSGGTAENLIFTSPLSGTTYFRRKVTETVSGNITCTAVAMINIR